MSEKDIFVAALQTADDAERAAYLDRACGANSQLRAGVEALLREHARLGSFLESPALAAVATPDHTVAQSDVPLAMDRLEPRVLGDYRIVREIGRGGMGVVYEAEQISLGRSVALKVLPFTAMLDKTQLARFKNEARAAASLDHPNVVPVHAVGTERGVHFYAMQLIDGQTVADLIGAEQQRRGMGQPTTPVLRPVSSGEGRTAAFRAASGNTSTWPEALKGTVSDLAPITATRIGGDEHGRIRGVVKLAIQAAEALEHAHRMGIVHRDIKPSNLLVDAEQHLWVADFGLAMVEAEAGLTTSGGMLGTLRYMSPEQVCGHRHILDHHADIYSLGATLYEMLTLRAAFPGSDVTSLMRRVSHGDPVAPRKLNSAIPRDLETIVLTAMAKDHEDRYATAAEMAADLRRFLDDEPIVARPPSVVYRIRKFASRHKGWLTTAAIAVLALITATGVSTWYAVQARRARRIADERLRLSQADFDRATGAIDMIIEKVGAQEFAGVPGMKTVRDELLQEAMTLYEQVVAGHAEDPVAKRRRADALTRLISIYRDMGEPKKGFAAGEAASALLEELIHEFPDDPELKDQLAKIYFEQAWTPFPELKRARREDLWKKSLAISQEALEQLDNPAATLARRRIVQAQLALTRIQFDNAGHVPGHVGQGLVFNGVDNAVTVADDPSLQLTKSITIEAWIRVDSFPAREHSPIFFRGDDRPGLDPYELTLNPGGTIHFNVNSLTEGASVKAPLPRGEFVYVVATLDDATGQMRLFVNGVRASLGTTTVRPFGALDPNSNPSIGVGNHGGFPDTPHNYPFHGEIDELKVYDVPLSESQILANFHAQKGNLLPKLSIDDAVVTEGEKSFVLRDAFVARESAGLSGSAGMTFGPDGNLYVADSDTDSVLRYDGNTGALIDTFVAAGSGGLDQPRDLVFGNGFLYVAGAKSNSVLRYDGTTGAFVDELVIPGVGGVELPRGLLIGPNNYLYVTSAGATDAVLRFDATTGAFVDEFIPSGDHGMDNPNNIALGPDGMFYVSNGSPTSNKVQRYDAAGKFVDDFISSGDGGIDGPNDLLFKDGDLFVANSRGNSVLAFDLATGQFHGEVVSSRSGGLESPRAILIDGNGDLLVSSRTRGAVLRYEELNLAPVNVRLSTVWPDPVTVGFTTAHGTALAGSDYGSITGTLTFAPGETNKLIRVSIIDDQVAEPDEVFDVVLSNPSGARIGDGTALVTIHDPDVASRAPTANAGLDQDGYWTSGGSEPRQHAAPSGPPPRPTRLDRSQNTENK